MKNVLSIHMRNIMKIVFATFFSLFFNSNLFSQIIFENFENNQLPSEIVFSEGVDGFVQIVLGDGYNSNRGVRMGKISDGNLTKNGIEITLDSDDIQPDMYLSFNIKDYADENHAGDGILLSINGQAFEQVYTFKPEDWCNNNWGAFPPFNLNSLAGTDLANVNNLVIRIQQEDDSDFISGGDADGLVIDNVSVFSAPPEYVEISIGQPFEDNFDNAVNNQLGPNWRWSHPDSTVQIPGTTKPTGIVGIFDGFGTANSKGVLLGKINNCDDGPTANALDLHLNLEDESDVFLSFSIRDNAEENHPQDGIFFSNDGGQHFEQVYTFKPEDWCANNWGAFPPFSIDALAESVGLTLTDEFVVRFQQFDDADIISGGDVDGLVIDNVSVFSAPPVYAKIGIGQPFEDNFDNAVNNQLGPNWRWAHPDSTVQILGTTKPTGIIGIFDSFGTANSKGVLLGKINNCDDGPTANALDLHLNLEDESDVFLSFSIRDNTEENHPQDGIFFSNDGGQHFKQVYTFKPEDWCDNNWGAFPPFSIDVLAESVGLTLTNRFVVRFQQFDDADIISGGDADGLVIDNVSVFTAPPVYAEIGIGQSFEDNFHNAVNNQLGPNWRWSHPDSTVQIPGTTKPTGLIGIFDGVGTANSKGVLLGKINNCDDGPTANTLDLYLNLENCSNVLLSFNLRDYFDEKHLNQDGLFFSNDAGKSFQSILPLNFEIIPDNSWMNFSINLDSLVSIAGLTYSNECIVRFQQYDDADFISGGDADGYALDNINVQCDIVNTVQQRFVEEMTIFPNPASSHIIVQNEAGSPYQLFNMEGRLLRAGTIINQSEDINLSGLPNGMLLLKVQNNEKTKYARFVKN